MIWLMQVISITPNKPLSLEHLCKPEISMGLFGLLFFAFSYTLVLHFNLSTAQTHVTEFCLGGNYTTNSTFQADLSILLSSISNYSTLTNNTKYFNNTVRSNSDGVYGLFQCRGDYTSEDCKKCAKTATEEVTIRCPFKKESVLFYDECLLHYSDKPVISTMQLDPTVDTRDISGTNQFTPRLNELMEGIVARAVSNSSSLFAVGENYFTSSNNIFGLAQCTQDISRTDCGRCLNRSISQLSLCCNTREGGRVIKPSCIVRFEIYNFFGPEAIIPALPPAPPPSTPNTNTTNGQGKKSSKNVVIIVLPTVIVVVLLLLSMITICFCLCKKKGINIVKNVDEISSVESLQFNCDTVRAATEDFCDSNKLGEGGFGLVYKGKLSNGKDIAVKRLSRNADPVKRSYLDWERRYKIIGGIARGLLYLHEDSHDRIIHRDLKASNILLDAQMNPKISDFGVARLFVVDQTQGNTSRVVGTYGYMSPEYAMHGQYSVKSDVFSFGVLVLEIISGQKNNSEHVEDLLSYAWRQWEEGIALELIEPTLRECYSRKEVMRCIHIGLLCAQEDVVRRPTMASVVLMLNSYSVTLPLPTAPPLFASRKEKGTWLDNRGAWNKHN
ncbi:hypothetical protein IFM89_008685 [Coptis chinensis]|uniref:Cysteine-rich receptor-like protein kinase 10 n=1 Tax=Coptis chinensis TaxID=261450 RepID=A0A835H031_9MAGN|nr:hypothetical protein IFM89_008685 [Coptis chinensis]